MEGEGGYKRDREKGDSSREGRGRGGGKEGGGVEGRPPLVSPDRSPPPHDHPQTRGVKNFVVLKLDSLAL